MKFQTLTALSLLLYSAAPASFAATGHSGGASAQVDQSTQSSMQTVASSVSGGQTIRSLPLELVKVNDIEGTGNSNVLGNLVGSGRNAATGSAQDALQTAASTEPGTLAMLLTGLGVMGSIARRRRLARKAA